MGSKTSGNRSGRPRAPGAGRRATTAIVHAGDGVLISQVYPDESYADLGRGRAEVKRIGNGRLITLPQEDGSEIRILIAR